MMNDLPRVVKVGITSNLLVITFDNNEKRFLRTHALREVEAISRGEKKSSMAKALTGVMGNGGWLGAGNTTVTIESDGTVILDSLNGNPPDIYTPSELWNDSVEHMSDL